MALTYGMVTPTDRVVADIRALLFILPGEAREFMGDWLVRSITRSEGREAGLLISIAIALFSALRAGRTIIGALNTASAVETRRGFVRRRIVALMIVFGGALLLLGALFAIASRGLPAPSANNRSTLSAVTTVRGYGKLDPTEAWIGCGPTPAATKWSGIRKKSCAIAAEERLAAIAKPASPNAFFIRPFPFPRHRCCSRCVAFHRVDANEVGQRNCLPTLETAETLSLNEAQIS